MPEDWAVKWIRNFSKEQKFSCIHCGDCCTKSCVPIYSDDLRRFPKALVQDVTINNTPKSIISGTNSGTCPLLKQSRCSEYGRRPFACREFPLNILKIRKDVFEVDLLYNCPGLYCSEGEEFSNQQINDLVLKKSRFNDYKEIGTDPSGFLKISRSVISDPVKAYQDVSKLSIARLTSLLESQMGRDSPLTGYDLNKNCFYALYLHDHNAVLQNKAKSIICDISKIKLPELQETNLLVKYLQSLWQRAILRAELSGSSDIKGLKSALEHKIYQITLSFAVILANLRNTSIIDDNVSAETMMLLDSIILQSLPALKKNL